MTSRRAFHMVTGASLKGTRQYPFFLDAGISFALISENGYARFLNDLIANVCFLSFCTISKMVVAGRAAPTPANAGLLLAVARPSTYDVWGPERRIATDAGGRVLDGAATVSAPVASTR
ncbi:hypothetical protein IOCL2690_000745400 [Leishmania lindenbergi]|uniref:Uncharacterized protein n=1 Tax=Leishmania lindenbergi TaxID=651832 RepID=A0AAW2ZWE1_9TRYP